MSRIWDWIGRKVLSKGEVPPGMDFCDACGKIYPKEDMHHVLIPGEGEVILCEECIEIPPSWLKFPYRAKRVKNETQ